jgi:N-dimethylarginine dimethylaminohydrolase
LILGASPISAMKKTDSNYLKESKRVNFFNKTISKLGFNPILVNINEFEKSGAALSCCFMTLNHFDLASETLGK